MTTSGRQFVRYRDRPSAFVGVREVNGYRLRCHEVIAGDGELDGTRFATGIDRIVARLPQPAVDDRRPGVGFLIQHQGATGDYLVLGWWDNENELPVRVMVRDDDGWRDAGERESFCVWDVAIIARERDRYVATVLGGPDAAGVEAYLWG